MLSWLTKRDRKAWVLVHLEDRFAGYECGGDCYERVDTRCGLVRVERRGRRAVLSVAVMPRFRRMGIAQKALTVASRWAIGHGWGTPTAYIMVGNTASILAFRGAGFEIKNPDAVVEGLTPWVTMELAT